MSTRRGFLGALLGGAVVAVTPAALIASAPVAAAPGVTSVTFNIAELVATTLRARRGELMANLTENTALFDRLRRGRAGAA